MRDAARLQAAIEILDAVILAAGGDGAAADTLCRRHFATRRYAGAKDRAAIRELVFAAIRFSAGRPPSGRALILGYASCERPDLLPLFDGSPHGPATIDVAESRTLPTLYPEWLDSELRARFPVSFEREMRALAARAPLDIRVNGGRADVAEVAALLDAAPIPGLRHGLRLRRHVALERHPLFERGGFEIQDAGSQQVARLAAARPGETVIDLCAGAGGKTLALAADMAGTGRLVACDSNRQRLGAMEPRLARCGLAAFVERRLLDPGKESHQLADLAGKADLLLVDAPCSGSGTWRRNPELRWRLDRRRLDRLLAAQRRLLEIAAGLLRPGGRLVYAVCSVLPAEGEGQALRVARKTGMKIDDVKLLSPASDGCDGFQIVQLSKIPDDKETTA